MFDLASQVAYFTECSDDKSSRDDLDYVNVLASLPENETVFEYLVGCWKRLNSMKTGLTKKVCCRSVLYQASAI